MGLHMAMRPHLIFRKVALTGPQLPAASRPRTKTRCLPLDRPVVDSVVVAFSVFSSKPPSLAASTSGVAPGIHGATSM
jgi:hypothetical protein